MWQTKVMIPGAFASLSPEAAEQLRGAGRCGQWGRGALLFHTDTPADTFYIVLSGSVRLYTLAAGGREVTLVVHTAGDVLGAAALTERVGQEGANFQGSSTLPHQTLYAECAADTEALALNGEAVRRLMLQSPEISLAITSQLIQQATALQEHFTALVFQEVSQRLATALLGLAQHPHQGRTADGKAANGKAANGKVESGAMVEWDGAKPFALQDRLSHQELAHIVGSTRETITKLLGEFRNRDLLELGYRRIVLTDKKGLEAAARAPLR